MKISLFRRRLHNQAEEYKSGWVRGFYSIVNDEGGPNTARARNSGIQTKESLRLYYEGYEDGQIAWRSGCRRGIVLEPQSRRGLPVDQLKERGWAWRNRWIFGPTQMILRFIAGPQGRGGL